MWPFSLVKGLQNWDQRLKLENCRTIREKKIILWILRKISTSHFAEYHKKQQQIF